MSAASALLPSLQVLGAASPARTARRIRVRTPGRPMARARTPRQSSAPSWAMRSSRRCFRRRDSDGGAAMVTPNTNVGNAVSLPPEVVQRLHDFLAAGGTGQFVLNAIDGRIKSLQVNEHVRIDPAREVETK